MKRLVLTAHRSNYPDPIAFGCGEIVSLGRTDDEFPGWIRTRLQNGKEGWAPQDILEPRADGTAIANSSYDARELDTAPGDILEVVRELQGWFWARNAEGREGWVPLKTTEEAP